MPSIYATSITNYKNELINSINNLENELVKNISKLIFDKSKNGQTIFVVGNGGSASTTSHFACDLVKNVHDAKGINIYSLNDNIGLITAYANDISYEDIFSKQLVKLTKPNDLLIVITGSGNSKNILSALNTCKELNIETVGLLGFNGGQAKDLCNQYIIVPSNIYGVIEDVHLTICHLITEEIKTLFMA